MADIQQPAAPAPNGESVADNPTNTNTEQTTAPEQSQAPDMQGFTTEQLADMRKFLDNNGGWEKVKSRISNPPKEEAKQPEQTQEPTSHTPEQTGQPSVQQQAKPIEGSLSANDFMMGQYFKALASEEKYAPIAKEIADGSILKEMNSFGIYAQNQDGSLNDQKVRKFLDLKAQTVHTEPTSTEPNASTAPTVDYVEVGENITKADDAYAILMQPGHPRMEDAKKFLKSYLNHNSVPQN